MNEPISHRDEPQGGLELLLVIAVSICFPPILLAGFFILNPREEIVVLRFGKYVTTLKTQGIRWILPVGRTLHRISTRDATLEIPKTTVVEKNGEPDRDQRDRAVQCGRYYKAALQVEDYHRFLSNQAGAVIKRVSSKFPTSPRTIRFPA